MMNTRRQAVALVEVLVSVAILGLALAPIVGIVHRSMSQIRAEKDEATAANMAGQILNKILFEVPYADVLARSYTTPAPESLRVLPGGNTTVDGTYLEWTCTFTELTNLRFLYRRIKYHTSHGAATEPLITPTSSGQFYTDPANSPADLYNNSAGEIDKKYSGMAVAVDVRLDIKWRSPGETKFGRTETLFVRRAKLE